MKKIIILLTTLFVSLSSQATLITVELNQNTYQVGDVLTANFIISEIEDDASALQRMLSGFGFDVSWNNMMIEYSAVRFGDKLDAAPGFSVQSPINLMANSLTLSETSYSWSDELFAVQNGLSRFLLASVDFNVVGAGNGLGSLDLSNVVLWDDFNIDFSDINSRNKEYSVTSSTPIDVPEPSSMVLMLMGFIFLVRKKIMS
ncbi:MULTISPECIES: PEP-CTERM sorting domain-containing protein [unclassified Colwellia]|uniref:PEP-CTERM sorting domain-containing protein n=1 Tax=unclassified Colwellia TaxID=196834 RepID=UPI0015F750E1|nr:MULTISPECIES: PEP-CTERM sorting domain-containing protein [unclassified Colwellia]MBA6233627.1 PEP-CTERM sorting domain-containing protein [Colwellia sp. MB02u-7]MBA6238187.1 PEP-CTERM sorting domain-containing protein [Colwellia sp. MB02u-11]MBA6255049.1 PEP-CTERM sorting domain-containing protein [Colwellia sp. MB3u-28]MBA6259000.1 PEP-CTERM sorting domain-containing protein [Colwellia sp. MB3u-41]MBA6299676.1 PEP-CTERM sorting domain-containing protein [Colwellia sp. MB3u-22]